MGFVGPPSPALFTSVSTRPNARAPASTIAFAPVSTLASPATATAWPPASRISATVSWTSASERAAHTTLAPSRAKRWLMTRPMPLLAPVTIATRSVNRATDSSCSRHRGGDCGGNGNGDHGGNGNGDHGGNGSGDHGDNG